MFETIACIWCYTKLALVLGAVISLGTYLVPYLIQAFYFNEQDLKKKYDAEWAVITGSSSGIGLALAKRLAKQGINIVMVARDDKFFDESYPAIQKEFPDVKFVKVAVNLADGTLGFMKELIEKTKDIKANIIVNNAGYIDTGLFADKSASAVLANYHCNATAAVAITHHFLNLMLERGQKGALAFTSSPAFLMPTPTTSMYGATKAFLTEFATTIAAEVKPDGIDVLVVHPSPVATGFYSGNQHNLSAMALFQKTATTPESIAACFLRSMGRMVVHDQGYYPVVFKILTKVLDYNLLADLTAKFASTNGDYKKVKQARPLATPYSTPSYLQVKPQEAKSQ
jgi:short-subunit dehydrogenase